MNKPASVLILGGSGRIGGDLHTLIRQRHPEVRLLGTGRSVETGDCWMQFDPFQDDWSRVSGPFDVVVNAIGAIRETKEMPYERIHFELTERILKERSRLGDPHIIQVSALGARSDHPVGFLASKGRADDLLLGETGTALVRPSVVCHRETMLANRLEKLLDIARFSLGKLFTPRGFADTRVQPILPMDLSELLMEMVVQRRTGVVEAVGGEVFTFRELLDMLADAQGRQIKLIEVPREIMEGFVRYFVSVWFSGTLNYDQFQLLFIDNVGDPAVAEQMLGRKLKTTRDFWEIVGKKPQEDDSGPENLPQMVKAKTETS